MHQLVLKKIGYAPYFNFIQGVDKKAYMLLGSSVRGNWQNGRDKNKVWQTNEHAHTRAHTHILAA